MDSPFALADVMKSLCSVSIMSDRSTRVSTAISPSAIAVTGRITFRRLVSGASVKGTQAGAAGRMFQLTAKMISRPMATRKLGSDNTPKLTVVMTWSSVLPARQALRIPSGTAKATPTPIDRRANSSVTGSFSLRVSATS